MKDNIMEMMSKMMKDCFEKMDCEEACSLMETMMPEMVEDCFSKMEAGKREEMFDKCREMFEQVEKEFSKQKTGE